MTEPDGLQAAAYRALGGRLSRYSDHNAPLIAPLILLGLIWLGTQPFIWSGRVRAEFSRH